MGGERGPVGGKTWGCAGPRARRGGIQVASDVGLLDVDAARTGAQTISCVSSCRSNSLECFGGLLKIYLNIAKKRQNHVRQLAKISGDRKTAMLWVRWCT